MLRFHELTSCRCRQEVPARAIERCGDLLEEIPPAHGANQNIQEGDLPKVTRESAATEAGLSEWQRKTALRVANVPKDEFEDAFRPPACATRYARGLCNNRAAPSS